jgi:small subunit ribosomal protein S10
MSTKSDSPKLRIKLKSYDLKLLESTISKILGLLVKSWADIKGPIPLPKKIKRYTVLKAHFVYKDARDQYERLTYARLVDVVETWPKTIEYLQNLAVPVGISVEVKVF